MYDVIIIGSGPAGMTAGIYAVRREMKTLIIGKEVGGQLIWANEIENYPGFESIKSFELIQRIRNQAGNFGAEFKDDEVKKLEKNEKGNFVIYTSRETFESKTVIISMGLSPRRLAVPGEIEFGGKGVSYCANCDGPFYKNKNIVIVGGGNSALDAAEYMSKIATHVYLVHRNDSFKAFDGLINEVKERENVSLVLNSEIANIAGNGKVENVTVIDRESKVETNLKVDGVFIEVGRIASTDLVGEFVDRNEKNQILVSSGMETKTPGLFAAGDVTECEYKQITVAMGQATIAALNAYQYIQSNTKLV